MAVHFIGFKDDRVWSARRIWGQPDFWHRNWDARAWQEVMEDDVAVFATGTIADSPKTGGSWDDSQADIMAYATEEQRK